MRTVFDDVTKSFAVFGENLKVPPSTEADAFNAAILETISAMTPEQREALYWRDKTCTHPGCQNEAIAGVEGTIGGDPIMHWKCNHHLTVFVHRLTEPQIESLRPVLMKGMGRVKISRSSAL